ncbi:hypothetical protein BD410DRAFT_723115 [Rickenella mellea]|uniref:Uncharacterized protein n=1 Tax=Rickenella mellea TaxID=50990 RepID=A0A4Y7Q562_9AGAM|nr:hypothetical protein BD410DRAFT_723115 [Rickenella mellea]
MVYNMSLTFLGTSSGGGPSESRSCSSLVLDIHAHGKLWMVDCAEGTLRQFAFLPKDNRLKVVDVTKVFITHMHFDHCMGLITLLANLLRGPPHAPTVPRSKPPLVELYGPAGLRTFVRSILTMTSTSLTERYAVHELLSPTDTPTSCTLSDLHEGETPGRDIVCDEDGLWRGFLDAGHVQVDAAPIFHRAPCLGYIFRSYPTRSYPTRSYPTHPSPSPSPERKIVILGDTSDPSACLPLASDATLLVHEATDTHIPSSIDRSLKGDKKSPASIEEKTKAKGHSTAGMAGAFARRVGARGLVVNHLSAKFPTPRYPGGKQQHVITEIERQASEAWGMGQARAAYDFAKIWIPVPAPAPSHPSHPSHPQQNPQAQQNPHPHPPQNPRGHGRDGDDPAKRKYDLLFEHEYGLGDGLEPEGRGEGEGSHGRNRSARY